MSSRPNKAPGGLSACRLIDVPTFSDQRGTLSVVEGGKELPFVPQRAFWIFGVPEGCHRGQHAHRSTDEAVICLKGSVEATLNDGKDSRDYLLDSGAVALFLAPMVWIDLHHFSDDALVLALASSGFTEDDYFRVWEDFLTAVKEVAE